MGAKTAMLVYADGPVPDLLRGGAPRDARRAADLASLVRPDQRVEEDGEEPWELADALYPPEGTVCTLSIPGLDVVCDQSLMLDRPSQLPQHLVAASRGRRLYLHFMHSVVDWLAFAIWDDGRLVRSLSLSPDDGIIEDIGDRLPFELPYWAGQHPLLPDTGDGEPYPLPFHPLDLGERALVELFGFWVEGCEGDGAEPVIDIFGGVQLHGFRVGPPPAR